MRFVSCVDLAPFPAIRFSPFVSVCFCNMPKGLPRAALSIGKKEDKTSWGCRCYQGEASEILTINLKICGFFYIFV
jgi:hypothetical protein